MLNVTPAVRDSNVYAKAGPGSLSKVITGSIAADRRKTNRTK
jgi:hypothetical protein